MSDLDRIHEERILRAARLRDGTVDHNVLTEASCDLRRSLWGVETSTWGLEIHRS